VTDQRTVTLQDVADRAGVTRGTASLALSGKGRIADGTRSRVRDAASELGYVGNFAARSLRTARSGTVGLYIPEHTLSYRYYLDVMSAAVRRGSESQLLVTLVTTDLGPGSGIMNRLDGFILVDPEDGDPLVARLLAGDKPVVSGEATPGTLPAPAGIVRGDHVRGIRLLLDHVWERGARNLLCLFPGEETAWGREMADGYRAWASERGIEPAMIMGTFHSTADDLRADLDARLAADPGIDGVITAPEGLALLAVDSLRAIGREIGRDVLVASYIDSDALALVEPSITSLDLQPKLFGGLCMELLIDAIDDPDAAPRDVDVPIRLVPRASTAG
jgi:DNA-binding LacI/PurR family transcriptional regulator